MRQKEDARTAVSTIAVTLVVVVLMAAGGIVGYFLANPGLGSHQTTETLPRTSGSATPTTEAFHGPLNVRYDFGTLLSLFSQMTVQSTSCTLDCNCSTSAMSFDRVGFPFVGRVQRTAVVLTSTDTFGTRSSDRLYFDKDGTLVGANAYGTTVTGASAQSDEEIWLFEIQLFTGFNGAIARIANLTQLQWTSNSTQTFGNVRMNVATYSLSTPTINATISVGRVPDSNYTIPVYESSNLVGMSAIGKGECGSSTWKVVTATRG
jgi:hypothetical protein